MGYIQELQSSDGFRFPAYIAETAGQPKGGIVCLQEVFGVNSHIREVADRLALEGFWVIAPSTFARVAPNVELGYTETDMHEGIELKAKVEALPEPGVLADIQSAIDYAEKQAVGKIGITGFCWGGLLAWRAATRLSGLSAAVTYYGGGMTAEPDISLNSHVPVMAHFGQKDHWISLESVDAFKKKHPEAQIHTYAADHGFNCDQRASYDQDAAQLAWRRTIEFFEKNLKF